MTRDLIAWVPVVFIIDCSKSKYFRLFYIIKAIRIFKALEKLEVG